MPINATASRSGQPDTAAILRHRGRELCLSSGRYAIGRHTTSDIVVDTALTSRRHALLTIGEDSATVEDLGSANGSWVNGKRISGTHRLRPGDCIEVGGDKIQLQDIGAELPEAERTLVGDNPRDSGVSQLGMGASGVSGTYPSAASTAEKHDGFELVGTMADRALANRRTQDAVDILRYRMTSVLEDAKQGRSVPAHVRVAALSYACKLAVATRDGRWVDYSLQLLFALFSACPDEVTDALQLATESVSSFDKALLERYKRLVRSMPPSLDQLRASYRAECLAQGRTKF